MANYFSSGKETKTRLWNHYFNASWGSSETHTATLKDQRIASNEDLKVRAEAIDLDDYNNLAIFGGSNVKIVGITVESCGSYPAGIYVDSVQDILIV